MSSSSLPDGLPEWVTALRERYGLTAEQIPTEAVLDLAAVAAHSITRPAAPLTTFVAGLIAGSRGGDAVDVDAIIAELADASRDWEGAATTEPDGAAGPKGGDR